MLKIGKAVLGKQPKIVLTIGEIKPHLLKPSLLKKVDILEVRIDCFKDIEEGNVVSFIWAVKKACLRATRKEKPIIATIRSKKEGGARYISPLIRLRLFKAVMPLVDGVDIEINSPILRKVFQEVRAKRKKVILSYHNFKQTPPDNKLKEIIKQAREKRGDIIKIACFAKSKKDTLRLLNLLFKHRGKNIVAISLGEEGIISRFLFPFFGSLWTYACLDKPFAPGQMNAAKMREALDRISNCSNV